ncbi:hypothetical protein ABRP92_15115 [Pectobacterium aroidearum]|uniref:hypothetical protein n=1 Tax=Pectobacterium aroidearum TaxID=1201031 RepID=UPI0032EB5715
MENKIKESTANTLKERISNPLWGSISFSWLAFNWQNISRLLMSKKDVEERIFDIISQDWFYLHYFISPLFFGALLAIATPYIKLYLSFFHKKAEQKERELNTEKEINKYNDIIIIADKKVEAENADNLARTKEKIKNEIMDARSKTSLSIINARKAKIEKSTDTTEIAYKEAQERLYRKIEELKITEEKINEAHEIYTQRSNHLNEIAKTYFKYKNISSREEFIRFLNEIKEQNLFNAAYLTREFNSMQEKELLNEHVNKTSNPDVSSDGKEH